MNIDWLSEALCAGAPTDLWFGDATDDDAPDDSKDVRQRNRKTFTAAKIICRQCPVSRECYEMATANGERHGVWGGITFGKNVHRDDDLRVMQAIWGGEEPTPKPAKSNVIQIRRDPPPCGTDAAHRAHLRRGETPCTECKAACSRAVIERRNRRRLAAEQPARERAAEAWA